MRLLNLGCGAKFHKDWINIDFKSDNKDVLEHNLLQGIPLNSRSVEVVYHSHVLEHFSKEDAKFFMSECFRVLKKNGIIRVAVPDLEMIASEYLKNLYLALNGDEVGKNNYEWIKLELLDQMVRNTSGGEMATYLTKPNLRNEKYIYDRIGHEGKNIREIFLKKERNPNSQIRKPQNRTYSQLALLKSKKVLSHIKRKFGKKATSPEEENALQIGRFRLGGEIHQWMYDRYSLSELLREAGFEEIKTSSPFDSEIINWGSYQLDVINGEVRKPDSLYMEAKKL